MPPDAPDEGLFNMFVLFLFHFIFLFYYNIEPSMHRC